MFDSVSFFFVLFSSVGSQFLVHWRVVVLFFFVVESENNSVLKGFCFDSFLFLFSSTEHTRRARENWLSFDMCLCIIFVFAFMLLLQKKEEEIVKLVWKPLEIELSWLRLCLLLFFFSASGTEQ